MDKTRVTTCQLLMFTFCLLLKLWRKDDGEISQKKCPRSHGISHENEAPRGPSDKRLKKTHGNTGSHKDCYFISIKINRLDVGGYTHFETYSNLCE